jgi:hypothetical protein
MQKLGPSLTTEWAAFVLKERVPQCDFLDLPDVQDLFATSFRISGDDLEELYSEVALAVSCWASRRAADEPPDVLQAPGDREVAAGYRLRWVPHAVRGRSERAVEVTLRHPDPQVSGREWRTAVDVCRRDDAVEVTIRVAREAIELRMTPAALTTLRRPALVPELLRAPNEKQGPVSR